MRWWRWICFIAEPAGRIGCSALLQVPNFGVVGSKFAGEADEGSDGLILPFSSLLHGGSTPDFDGCFCRGEQELVDGGGMFHFGKRSTWLPCTRVEGREIAL